MASVCPKSISEIHRHKEAVDDRLVPAGVVAVEDPVVAVLARQRVPGRNAIAVAVDHVIVVRYPMDLVGTKMVGVGRPAAGGLHPGRHGLPIGPDLMGFGAAADEAEAENEWKDVDPRFHLAFSAQRIRGGCSPTIPSGRNCVGDRTADHLFTSETVQTPQSSGGKGLSRNMNGRFGAGTPCPARECGPCSGGRGKGDRATLFSCPAQ